MIPEELWKVLTPDERLYLARLIEEGAKDQSLAEFAATVKAMLALFMRESPEVKLTLELLTDEQNTEENLRAMLTEEENKHLELRVLLT